MLNAKKQHTDSATLGRSIMAIEFLCLYKVTGSIMFISATGERSVRKTLGTHTHLRLRSRLFNKESRRVKSLGETVIVK